MSVSSHSAAGCLCSLSPLAARLSERTWLWGEGRGEGRKDRVWPPHPSPLPRNDAGSHGRVIRGGEGAELGLRLHFRGTRADDDRRVTGTTWRVHLHDSSFDLAVVEVDTGVLEGIPHAFLTA